MKKIGYLGIPGSFSHIAALRYFDNSGELVGLKSFKEIAQKVENGELSSGILPIENTVSGSVVKNYDLLITTHAWIIGEVYLRVHQNLLTNGEVTLTDLTRIYSHPEALSQCEEFLSNLNAERIAASDTAKAAQDVAIRKLKNEAAVGSREAAKLYGLTIAQEQIETNKANYTRFIIIAKDSDETGNKVSLLFTLEHKPGTLHQAIKVLAENQCNLTKIESRPMLGKPFEYQFYLDFEHENINNIHKVLEEIKQATATLRVLGRYERGKQYEE